MNKKPIIVLVISALLVGGCGKQSTANNNSSQPLPVQAEPFHGQVYKSVDGRFALTLTSKDECELTKDGTTVLCKYTKQSDALRVIATVTGTTQVIYFRFIDQGIQSNDGHILLAPQQYADAMAKIQQEEEARQKEEAERQKKAQEKQRLEEKIAQENQNCTIETKTTSSFSLLLRTPISTSGLSLTEGTMTITDVSIELKLIYHYSSGSTRSGGCAINFLNLLKIGNVGDGTPANSFSLDYSSIIGRGTYFGNDKIFGFKSEADANAAHDALTTAFNSWKGTFPDVVQH